VLIGMDVDGVMTHYLEYKIEKGSIFFGKPPVDPNAYDIASLFGADSSAPEAFWEVYQRDYMINGRVREGLYGFTEKMYANGHSIVIITNRLNSKKPEYHDEVRRLTEEFLDKHLFKYEKVYYSRNNKPDIARELGIDCMVEDAARFIEGISAVCPVIYPVLPYNCRVEPSENRIPVNSFAEAETAVATILSRN